MGILTGLVTDDHHQKTYEKKNRADESRKRKNFLLERSLMLGSFLKKGNDSTECLGAPRCHNNADAASLLDKRAHIHHVRTVAKRRFFRKHAGMLAGGAPLSGKTRLVDA